MTESALPFRLREIIAAIDRRRPGGLPTEALIARDAAAVRADAVRQLAALGMPWRGKEPVADERTCRQR